MKASIIYAFMAVAMLTSTGCGDKKVAAADVPQPVTAAFNAKYVDAKDVEWITEKEDGNTVYEASFKAGDKKREAEFKPDGTFVKEEDK